MAGALPRVPVDGTPMLYPFLLGYQDVSDEEFPRENLHSIAREDDPVPGKFHADRPAPGRALEPGHLRFSQFLSPVGRKAAMGRPGHRVLGHANGRRKESGDEIKVRQIGYGCHDDAPGLDEGECVHVGFKAAYIIGKGKLDKDVEPVTAGIQWLDTERLPKAGDRHGGLWGLGREIHADPVALPPGGQLAGECLKDNLPAFGHATGLVQHGRSGERCMPAELNLLFGREPPQPPARSFRKEKRGLRVLQLCGYLLHPRIISRAVRDADAGNIPAERGMRKSVNKVQFCLHGGEVVFPGNKGSGRGHGKNVIMTFWENCKSSLLPHLS